MQSIKPTVQETYFSALAEKLNLTKEGEDWLFDYIYNSQDENYDDFEHYLNQFNKTYSQLTSTDMLYVNETEAYLSTDFGEFSPMLHMSSYEPDLETSFPPAYNDNEPVSLGLDTITIDKQNV
jgi:hypothetical protein